MSLPANPTEYAELLDQLQSGKQPSLRRLLKTLPRPYPDPQGEWHLQLYDQYTTLKRALRKRPNTAQLPDDDLKDLKIIRGAALNIDESHPIDVEPRYFAPGSSRRAVRYAQRYAQRLSQWTQTIWPEPVPEESWRLNRYGKRKPDVRHVERFVSPCCSMVEYMSDGKWHCNPFWTPTYSTDPDPTKPILRDMNRIESSPEAHEFCIDRAWHYRRLPGFSRHSAIPHFIVTMSDTIVPDNRILRGEVLVAVSQLQTNLATRKWRRHYTHPLLMFSFHEGGARILQVHAQNGYLHIRVSRKLNLLSPDGSVPEDAKVVVRWMLAQPRGDTSFSETPSPRTTIMQEADDQNQEDPGTTHMLDNPVFAHKNHDEQAIFVGHLGLGLPSPVSC